MSENKPNKKFVIATPPPPRIFTSPIDLGEYIGHGAFGTVYANKNDPSTVVKVPHTTYEGAIKWEISALMMVDQFVEWGYYDSTLNMEEKRIYYVFMTRVHGYNMRQSPMFKATKGHERQHERRVFVDRVVELSIKQVFLILNEHGVLHWDIKPENVIIEGDGLDTLKITLVDWGIVKMPGPCGKTDDDIVEYIRDKFTLTYHPDFE